MTEHQIAISYNSRLRKLNIFLLCLFLPVWSMFLPLFLMLFISWNTFTQSPLNLWLTIFIVGIFGIFILAGFWLSYLAEDDKIYLSKNGLIFPWFFYHKLANNLRLSWSKLMHAELITENNSSSKILLLDFANATLLPLNLKYLKNNDIEDLLLAIELWGINCKRSDELIQYQNLIQNSNKGLDQISYTQLWQEELSRRFNAITFIPLEPDHKLQNGQLTVIRQLAFGGFSAIYLVQKAQAQLFVLKEAVVPQNCDLAQKLMAEKYLSREFAMLTKLNHPQIAQIYDCFVEAERNYLLIEYINGIDLRQYVRQNGVFNEYQVINLAIQLSLVLEYLHNYNPCIIHRDFTPDNIVFKNELEIVVIDFGCANEFLGTATGTLVGKQAYIAPEQFRGQASPQSDLYALGGSLFYLLTGQDPIPLAQTITKDTLPGISDDMNNLISNLTCFESSQRLQTIGEVLKLLKSIKSFSADYVKGN